MKLWFQNHYLGVDCNLYRKYICFSLHIRWKRNTHKNVAYNPYVTVLIQKDVKKNIILLNCDMKIIFVFSYKKFNHVKKNSQYFTGNESAGERKLQLNFKYIMWKRNILFFTSLSLSLWFTLSLSCLLSLSP